MDVMIAIEMAPIIINMVVVMEFIIILLNIYN